MTPDDPLDTDRGERTLRATRSHAQPLVIVIGAFIVSRAVLYALGVRFDADAGARGR